jgi:hypothetical protein
MQTKVLITSVPWTDTDSPLMAPAVLKSCLNSHGFSTSAIDLNAEVKNKMNSSKFKNEILEFFLTEQVSQPSFDAIYEIVDYMVDRILENDPDWVCLSLLTYLSQIPARWICLHLRQRKPNVKIVIGGPGCFVSLKGVDTYAQTMRRHKLVDYFVSGDGELALPQLLMGNSTYPGINSLQWQELNNQQLDTLPLPDYDDYNWNLYKIRRVSVWGSRGCVRNCTFCDIHEHWNKFTWRSAESIFNEMKYQYEKYGINVFSFADSLVNGNQKVYRKLIKLLADFNADKLESDKIQWTGYLIFRPKEDMTEEDWRLTALSGAAILAVGIESFVEHIRYHMKKKFSNHDIDVSLQMCKKYKIKLSFLLIVGYVTETQEDHDYQIAWVKANQHYAQDPVVMTQIGSGLGLLPGTELHRTYKDLGIVLNSETIYQDWVRPETGSTPELRMQWHQEMYQVLQDCGFKPNFYKDNHMLIEQYLAQK